MDAAPVESWGRRWARQSIAPGADAVRRLWKPFLAVQTVGLLVVVAYFHAPAFAAWCASAAELKQSWGLLFAAVSMPIASALTPEAMKFATGVDRSLGAARWRTLGYGLCVFACMGVFVDLLYAALARWPGEGRAPTVVATKLLIDQLLFCPLLSLPWIAGCYGLRRAGFSVRRMVGASPAEWYGREVVPLLLPCWAYWFPMASLMYVLPTSLTFLFGMCASAASATLLVAVATRDGAAASGAATGVASGAQAPRPLDAYDAA